MLELTNLASVLEIHSSLEAAIPGADSWPGYRAVGEESKVEAWEEFSQVRE
jgi:hypothetical protein